MYIYNIKKNQNSFNLMHTWPCESFGISTESFKSKTSVSPNLFTIIAFMVLIINFPAKAICAQIKS